MEIEMEMKKATPWMFQQAERARGTEIAPAAQLGARAREYSSKSALLGNARANPWALSHPRERSNDGKQLCIITAIIEVPAAYRIITHG